MPSLHKPCICICIPRSPLKPAWFTESHTHIHTEAGIKQAGREGEEQGQGVVVVVVGGGGGGGGGVGAAPSAAPPE